MAAALKRQGCELSFFRLVEKNAARVKLESKITRIMTGKHIVCERDPRIARHFPAQINAGVDLHHVDAVLGTSAFYMVAQNCPVPSIFWGDTTVAGVLGRYPYYRHLTRRSIRDCHALEQKALDSCALAIFSSQWAADVACTNYACDTNKIKVIPYGANVFTGLTASDIAACLRRREAHEWELLFVGIEWERKGAQIAIDAVSILRARGISVRLTLVGCLPPRTANLPDYVTVIGSIDKSNRKGQALLSALYMQSHLMILPTRAECAAISLAEASAHGVPSLSTNVGGNDTLVKDGINGYLLPLEAEPTDFANYTQNILSDTTEYAALCWSSFERFQTDLNWDVAVSRLITEIESILNPTDKQYACSRAS